MFSEFSYNPDRYTHKSHNMDMLSGISVFLTPSKHPFETTVWSVILKFAQIMHCVTFSILGTISLSCNLSLLPVRSTQA